MNQPAPRPGDEPRETREERVKRKRVEREARQQPGTLIRAQDGRKVYVVEDDGSWRKLPPETQPRAIEVLRTLLAVPKRLWKALMAPPAPRGLYERILQAKDGQAAAELFLEGSNRYRGASSGTRRKWRRAVERVTQRERMASLRRPA